MDSPTDRLRALPLGSRVVVRYRIEGGFTDALGYLRSWDEIRCTVETKRGSAEVPWDRIVAAKPVPPPPAPRPPRAAASRAEAPADPVTDASGHTTPDR